MVTGRRQFHRAGETTTGQVVTTERRQRQDGGGDAGGDEWMQAEDYYEAHGG